MPNSLFSRRLFVPSLVCAGLVPIRSVIAEEPLTMEAFRDELIAVGRRRFPELALEPGRGASEVRSKDHQLRLENVFVSARESAPERRESIIVDWLAHFTLAARSREDAVNAATDDWEQAKSLLRPKLVGVLPSFMEDRLIWHPFVGDTTVIYSIDLGDRDLYVSKDKAAGWRIAQEVIHSRAVSNLEAMSSGLALKPSDGKGTLINIRFSDGYDAARLILPELRRRLMMSLGSPFHAAVPARDLFMAWSTGNDTFEREMASEAMDFSKEMNHPVSGLVYTVDGDGVRPI